MDFVLASHYFVSHFIDFRFGPRKTINSFCLHFIVAFDECNAIDNNFWNFRIFFTALRLNEWNTKDRILRNRITTTTCATATWETKNTVLSAHIFSPQEFRCSLRISRSEYLNPNLILYFSFSNLFRATVIWNIQLIQSTKISVYWLIKICTKWTYFRSNAADSEPNMHGAQTVAISFALFTPHLLTLQRTQWKKMVKKINPFGVLSHFRMYIFFQLIYMFKWRNKYLRVS